MKEKVKLCCRKPQRLVPRDKAHIVRKNLLMLIRCSALKLADGFQSCLSSDFYYKLGTWCVLYLYIDKTYPMAMLV